MANGIKIIVAHPGKQHSFHTAVALDRQQRLEKYITTIYDKPLSLTRLVTFLLRGTSKKKAASRKTTLLENHKVVQYKELNALLLLLISKISWLNKFWPILNLHLSNIFGKRVARAAKKTDVDMVISYDCNSTVLFRQLKKELPNAIRVLDVSSAARPYMKKIFQQDAIDNPDSNILEEQKSIWNPTIASALSREIKDSDYYLVGSNFVKASLVQGGVKPDKVYIVPYGANLSVSSSKYFDQHSDVLRLLYVGQITYLKGLHHLLRVVSTMENVELDIAGQVDPTSTLFEKYQHVKNIHFLGFLTHDDLAKEFLRADWTVSASLSEGFGMAILEAMASGLPALVSNHCGIADAIINKKNGLIFQSGDDDELKEGILWALSELKKLPELSRDARISMERYSWKTYSEELNNAIDDMVSRHKMVNK